MQVVAQLLGNKPLPWESMSTEDRRKLGAFRGPILQLLNRDPSQRPTMPEFYHACNSIFSTSTTYTAGPAARDTAGHQEDEDDYTMTIGAYMLQE